MSMIFIIEYIKIILIQIKDTTWNCFTKKKNEGEEEEEENTRCHTNKLLLNND